MLPARCRKCVQSGAPGGHAALRQGSTRFAFEPNFYASVRVDDGGGDVGELQQLVQPLLLPVHAPFLVHDPLASPRLAQLIADASTLNGVDDGNAWGCHRSSVLTISVDASGLTLGFCAVGV